MDTKSMFLHIGILFLNSLCSLSYGKEIDFVAEKRAIKIMGHSGKIRLGDEHKNVGIEFDSVSEVSSSGEAVGTASPTKHTFKAFTNQNFTFSQLNDTTIFGNVSAKSIEMSGQLVGLASILKVNIYFIKEDANVTLGGKEDLHLRQGMMKFDLELSGWSWCGCMKGNTLETGAYLDVGLVVKGNGTAQELSPSAGRRQAMYSLGDKQNLQMSSQVETDGVYQALPTGYPKLTLQGDKPVFTIRIPRFNIKAVYDPIVSVDPTPLAQTDSPSGGSNLMTSWILYGSLLFGLWGKFYDYL